MSHPFFALDAPVVFGHRGAAGERPENTLTSFEHALAEGAQVIETDVHRTRDGEVVVLHDADVARTTDGRGNVSELTASEVGRLDAGYRFRAADGSTPYRGEGLRVPHLEEAFERFPGVPFNIELKRCDAQLVATVVGLVRRYRREEVTLLAAERDDTMALLRAELRQRDVRIATGASRGDVIRSLRAALLGAPPPPGPLALQIPASFLGLPLATRRLIGFAHRHGLRVHVWTINDIAEMERLLALGVDGLMSDFPGRLRRVVDARTWPTRP
jgi:glycerophosphoryl diester phosphodiesterase